MPIMIILLRRFPADADSTTPGGCTCEKMNEEGESNMIQQSLGMEFVVMSAVKPLTGVLNEVLEQSSFRIEPYRRLSSANAHKYQVFFVTSGQMDQTPCGWLEFIASRPGKTTVRLEPQRVSAEHGETNDMLMTRLFYLFVQRLVQLDIVVAGKTI